MPSSPFSAGMVRAASGAALTSYASISVHCRPRWGDVRGVGIALPARPLKVLLKHSGSPACQRAAFFPLSRPGPARGPHCRSPHLERQEVDAGAGLGWLVLGEKGVLSGSEGLGSLLCGHSCSAPFPCPRGIAVGVGGASWGYFWGFQGKVCSWPLTPRGRAYVTADWGGRTGRNARPSTSLLEPFPSRPLQHSWASVGMSA